MDMFAPSDMPEAVGTAQPSNCRTIFAESVVFEDCAEVIKVILYRHRVLDDEREERVGIAVIVMPRPNFYRALMTAIAQMLPVVPGFLKRMMH